MLKPISRTPALKEAIRRGVPELYWSQILTGGFIALENHQSLSKGVSNIYSELNDIQQKLHSTDIIVKRSPEVKELTWLETFEREASSLNKRTK